jgi:flagellar basal-body rod modification protein FlgD
MPIDATSASTYVAPPSTVKPKSQLDMETFMRLLTTQLANQNPLEPMNDRDFFAQMAQLGTVQGMDSLNKSMQVSQASAMIGKTVTAVRPMTEGDTGSNDLVTGVVTRLQVINGDYYLGLRQEDGGMVDVKMGNIQKVEG